VVKGGNQIKSDAGSIKIELALELCWALNSALDDEGKEFVDFLEFIGINLCFASLNAEMWPIRGHYELSLTLRWALFFAKAGIRWQTDDFFKNELGLCEGEEPSCDNEENTAFCTMAAGQSNGYFSV